MTGRCVDAQVAIVGGGPGGCAAALTLLRSGLSVVLIDGSRFPLQRGEIFPGSLRSLLEVLDVWPKFLNLAPTRITEILSAWGSGSIWANDLSLHPFGCSWAVRRCDFDEMLRQSVIRAGGLYLRASMRAARLDKKWLIETHAVGGDETVAAEFVVDATGSVSAFARMLGVRKRRLDSLVAVSTVVDACGQAFKHSLLIESVFNGWWYSTPLPNSKLCCSFLTDSSEHAARGLQQKQNWQRALSGSRFTREQLRICEPTLAINVTPAFSAALESVHGDRWVAVGDAASSVDPLCGAGVARALASGIDSAKCIETIFRNLRGDALKDYAVRQQKVFVNAAKMRSVEYSRAVQWSSHQFWKLRRTAEAAELVS